MEKNEKTFFLSFIKVVVHLNLKKYLTSLENLMFTDLKCISIMNILCLYIDMYIHPLSSWTKIWGGLL